MTITFSLILGRNMIRQYRSIHSVFSTIKHIERVNHRTISLCHPVWQASNSTAPSTNSDKKSTSILGTNSEELSKTPFIFSQVSSAPKFVDESSSKKDNNQEQRDRENNAAWEMKMLKYTAYFLGIWIFSTAGYIVFVWGGPQVGPDGSIITDEYSTLPTWEQYIKRAFRATIDYWQTIKDPTSDKLLPDPLPPGYQPPYTLVIEMSGVLLSPEWHYNTGWRYKKRPGLDYFLKEVGYPTFEVVIYTKDVAWHAASVSEHMDPEHRIMYRLFRENTRFINGAHVKDLSCLNRDLKKVIILDWDEKAYQLQPRNALHRLDKWEGSDDDRGLVHLATFLRMIAKSGVEDVRDVLDHYNQETDPVQAFLIRQQALREAEEQKQKVAANNAPVKQASSIFKSWAKTI